MEDIFIKIIGSSLVVLMALIGVIWRALTSRIDRIELQYVNKELYQSQMQAILSRFDRLESKVDSLLTGSSFWASNKLEGNN